MQLTLIPVRRDDRLQLSRAGDVLTVQGDVLDFSGLPEGATLPKEAVKCAWLASDVERIDGQIQLSLILPHGPKAPEQSLFPDLMVLTEDGPVALPPHDLQEAAQ